MKGESVGRACPTRDEACHSQEFGINVDSRLAAISANKGSYGNIDGKDQAAVGMT